MSCAGVALLHQEREVQARRATADANNFHVAVAPTLSMQLALKSDSSVVNDFEVTAILKTAPENLKAPIHRR